MTPAFPAKPSTRRTKATLRAVPDRAGEAGVGHDRVDPAGMDRFLGLTVVENQEVRRERHQLPRDGEGHRIRGERHEAHREHEDEIGEAITPLAAGGAHGVDRRGYQGKADQRQEKSAERVEGQLEASEGYQPRQPKRPDTAEHAITAEGGGADPGERGESVREPVHQRRRPIASRMPARRAAGEGGHPEMTVSTGTTSATPPTTA